MSVIGNGIFVAAKPIELPNVFNWAAWRSVAGTYDNLGVVTFINDNSFSIKANYDGADAYTSPNCFDAYNVYSLYPVKAGQLVTLSWDDPTDTTGFYDQRNLVYMFEGYRSTTNMVFVDYHDKKIEHRVVGSSGYISFRFGNQNVAPIIYSNCRLTVE